MPDSILQRWLKYRGYGEPVNEGEVLGDLPYSPSSMALAVNPKTLVKFQEQMLKNKVIASMLYPEFTDAVHHAMGFVNTRYPRLGALAKDLDVAKMLGVEEPLGYYDAPMKQVGINLMRHIFNRPKAVGTYAHELTHALTHKRWGDEKFMEMSNEAVPYMEKVIEKMAHKAGSTARSAYEKYYDLLNNIRTQ